MKVKVSNLVNAHFILSHKVLNVPMNFKLSYCLSKISKKMESELKEFDKIREDLMHKMGTPNEKGVLVLAKEKHGEFTKALEPTLNKEIELDIQPISASLLEKAGVKLSPKDIEAVEQFLDDDLDKKEELKK